MTGQQGSEQESTAGGGFARILRFGSVGGASSLVYFILASGFTLAFPGNEVTVSIVAYLCCIGFSFVLQRRFTFRSSGVLKFEFPRFAFVSVLGLALSTAIVFVATSHFGLSPFISYMIVIATIPVISYILFSHYVFNEDLP